MDVPHGVELAPVSAQGSGASTDAVPPPAATNPHEPAKGGGFVKLPAWLTTDGRMLGLTHRQFRIFIHLLAHCWRAEGTKRTNMMAGQVLQSVAEIARDLHIQASHVYADVRRMVKLGLLHRANGRLVVLDQAGWIGSGQGNPETGVGVTATVNPCSRNGHCGVTDTATPRGRNGQTPVADTVTGRSRYGHSPVADTVTEESMSKEHEALDTKASRPPAAEPSDVKTSDGVSKERESDERSDDDVSRACGTADGPSSSPGVSESSSNNHSNGHDGSQYASGSASPSEPDPTGTRRMESPEGLAPTAATSTDEVDRVHAFLLDRGLTPSQADTHSGSLSLAEARALFAQVEHGCRSKAGSNPVAIVVSILKQGRAGVQSSLRGPGARAATRAVLVGTSRTVTDEEMRASIDGNRRLLAKRSEEDDQQE